MMDEKRMVFVVRVVGVLVLLSICTDLGASVMRIIYYKEHVHYPRRLLTFFLEIIAAVALAIAHAIINVETGCACVPRQLNVNFDAIDAIITLICFGFSWFTFATASLVFLARAVFDLGYFRHIMKVIPSGSGAVVSSFCCLGFDVVYYILYSVNTTSRTAQVIPDIELGQPQLPPTNC